MAAYPRKQTVVILIVCILAVGGFAFYARGSFSTAQTQKFQDIAVLDQAAQQELPSNTEWRKQFLGENATSTVLKGTSGSGKPVAEEKLTATDLLGRAFITRYSELRRAGLASDEKAVAGVMNQVTEESIAALPTPKTFSLSEIKFSASSTVALHDYGKAVTVIFERHMPQQNEAEVANQAFTDGDMTQLKKIDPIIASYKTMIKNLIATPVPVPLASFHIDLLNALSMSLYNAESFRNMDIDPIRGLAAVSLELVALENMLTALRGMNRYFQATGVVIGS